MAGCGRWCRRSKRTVPQSNRSRAKAALIQASEDGEAITYLADGPIASQPEANRSPDPTQVLSTRGPDGWESQDIVTPHEKGEGIEPDEAPRVPPGSQATWR